MPRYYRVCSLIACVLFLVAFVYVLQQTGLTPQGPFSPLALVALAGAILCAGLLI